MRRREYAREFGPRLEIPPIPHREIMDLLRLRVAPGDPDHGRWIEARNRVVRSFVPLCRQAAWGHHWQADPEDAEQWGMVGLIEAAERFDPESGNHFSTYARHWVRSAIQRGIASSPSLVRVPVHARWLVATGDGADSEIARDARRALACRADGDDGRRPDDEEGHDAGIAALAAEVTDEDDRLDASLVAELARSLPDRERLAIELRYGLDGLGGRTQAEAGRAMGHTKEWVHKLETAALARLREVLDPSMILGARPEAPTPLAGRGLSGYVGVYRRSSGRFEAQATGAGHVGAFGIAIEAAVARDRAVVMLGLTRPRLNFPERRPEFEAELAGTSAGRREAS